MNKGHFIVNDQQKIGNADGDYETVQFVYEILGELFFVDKPIQYKYTDPVKGEILQPLYIVPAINIDVAPKVVLQNSLLINNFNINIKANKNIATNNFVITGNTHIDTLYRVVSFKDSLQKDFVKTVVVNKYSAKSPIYGSPINYSLFKANDFNKRIADNNLTTINYDHIPTIAYTNKPSNKILYDNIIAGKKKVGYIYGAGDKVPEALLQLGYTVDMLKPSDITFNNIKKYDAIITGIRSYNTNDWMNEVYDKLMLYIKNGGNLIVQYNTSNQIGPIKAKIAPFPFTISRNRITDENAVVTFIQPNETVLNYPNKLTEIDFNNWVQERSIYEATEIDTAFRKVFVMNDKNEKSQNGSLIIAPYGKGNFVYCSLALFRQLPAGVAGAYKLMANMINLPKNTNGM